MASQNWNQELYNVFKEFDVNNDNSIELSEIKTIAAKLGSQISEEELKSIMKNLDTNKDGKISFEEFKFWWEKGHKGQLGKLVYLKAKTMKATNSLLKAFEEAGVNLDNYEHSQEVDKHNVEIFFGKQEQNGMKLSFKIYQQGQRYKNHLELLKNKLKELNEANLSLIIAFPSHNPQQAKESIQNFIKSILSSAFMPFQIQDLENNSFVSIKIRSTSSEVLLHVEVKEQIMSLIQNPLSIFEMGLKTLGDEFYSYIEGQLKTNFTLENLLDQSLIESLLKGFSLKLNVQATSSLCKKVKVLGENKTDDIAGVYFILALLRKTNIKIKLRNPEQMDKFLEKLGIKNMINECPNVFDFLQQFSSFPEIQQAKNNVQSPTHLIYKLLQFANKYVESKFQVYALKDKTFLSAEIKIEKAGKIFNILFNEL